ncbi:ABC-type amino acid transport/signal transduction systems, periplasmic component/domain [Bacillus sp. OxB-1]|uniref:basic amino acid ABC transporter substrate-binding protein n=1 Tax=Bacillus sp. (strain OxB-1) TaxID=98228 RepID=UPI00058231F8|nr:basic amino acid ABC transporter substrate-binding protein [Bacillus sp. OxB-1]BAQ10853.1 ABC-type amino acid transport/signal transduction systems, periplasmic component/domain [Bacillus sp. OxB-1]
MSKVFRGFITGVAFILLSILLVGCGTGGTSDGNSSNSTSGSSGGNESTSTEGSPTSEAETDSKKRLIVGTDATYAPMEYMDSKGNIVGIDIDVVNAIAEAAGFEVEYKNYGWDPLFPAVDNSEVDFAVSSITITDDRKKNFDFSDPYFIANQLILVPEGSDVESFEDLKDKRVAVQINTTGHMVVQGLLGKTSSKILAAETMPLAITEMINGNADSAVGDNAVIIDYQKNNPKVKLKTVEDDSFEKEYYGLMVKKGNQEVLDLLNEGIKTIKENGKLKEITGFDVE